MFNVLVVDDDDQFLSLFRQDADTWTGVKIDTASSMKEAEESLNNTPCDMVISEYSLGEENGIDLLRYIRSRHGEIPFILLASHGSEEIAADASRFGISAYFMKRGDPVSLFSELYGKIRSEMQRKGDLDMLRERETRCRIILESQPGLICRFGPDLVLTFVNRTFAQFLGKPSSVLVGTSITDYIVPDEKDIFSNVIGSLSPDNQSAILDLKFPLPNNHLEDVHLTAWTFTAAFTGQHTPAIIQGTGKDVAQEREHAEEQARQLENLAFLSRSAMEFMDIGDKDDIFRFIAEKVYSLLPHSAVSVQTYDPVVKTFTIRALMGDDDILSAFRYWFGRDLEGLVLHADQYTFPQVGLSRRGIIEGPSLYHIFIFTFPEETCKHIEKSCSLGKIYMLGCSSQGELFGNVTFVLRKGDTIPNPKLLEAFVNQASVALLRWMTRKAAEEEIAKVHAGLEQVVAERTAALQAANKNLESFSYSVSHDLRAPLRYIEGFSSILQKEHGKDLSQDGIQLIEKIRQNTLRMADLIDAILEFSRAGRKELQRERIDVQTMARELLDELAASRPEQQIETVIGDLPPCMADPILMHQVLQNLLSNALKFSRCRDTSKIEVGSYDNGGQTVYYVRDNGIGIDTKYADRLFNVFEQLHNDKKNEGTGIGLAIVDNIIRRHGGKVWIESEIDKGFSCYFTTRGGKESGNH